MTTRGRVSKIPKKLTTWFMDYPRAIMLASGLPPHFVGNQLGPELWMKYDGLLHTIYCFMSK